MGYVYVFNASLQQLRLVVNEVTSSAIQGAPPPGKSPTPYRPFQIQVNRVPPVAPGIAFADGQPNRVIVQLPDRQSSVAVVPVPGPSQTTQDLWLYVTSSLLLLFSTEGKVLSQTTVDWGTSSTTPPPTERS
jgi:hypothetical protein